MLVTWPLVMRLPDHWPLRRLDLSTLHTASSTLWRLVREKIPFLLLAAFGSVLTFLAHKQGGAMSGIENLPLDERLGNVPISYALYVWKLCCPTNLAALYPHPGHWALGKVLLASEFVLGISLLLLAQGRRAPYLLMGWLWFLGTLVPVIGLVQVGAQSMADRYTYLPSVGMLVLAVWGASEWTRAWRNQSMLLSVPHRNGAFQFSAGRAAGAQFPGRSARPAWRAAARRLDGCW
jgi:hypothetical protein